MQNKIETSIPIVIISSDPDSFLFKRFVFIKISFTYARSA